MELIQLHQLTTIADEKVLSHAAEKLNISQPALSRSIQHLEDEFELKLFDRKKNSIKFSDLSGKEIREYTKIGFWHKLHRGCIHDASYIEYDDMMVYANIVKSQNYLTFVTELGNTLVRKQDKSVTIPITDKEATAHYRLAYLKKNFNRLQKIIEWAETAAKSW